MSTTSLAYKIVTGVLMMAVTFSAAATTLIRAGVDKLTDDNQVIVVGQVADATSYWNEDRTFILTNLRVVVHDSLKGDQIVGASFVATIMGGQVGATSTLIVGGARLVPGKEYVLFLNREDLPGAKNVLTTRDLSQAVFEVVDTGLGGHRAVSQASRHPLLPDASGNLEAPGGDAGLPLGDLLSSIRRRVTTSPGSGG